MTPSVLIAGGGPAAVEGLLRLRRLLPDASVELIAPADEFVYRPLAVSEPFGTKLPDRFSLARIAEIAGAGYRRDAITGVNVGEKQVVLASGRDRKFDALLVAIGARPTEAVPGAVTFWGQDGDPAFTRVLAAAVAGKSRITFAVPHRVRWSLPLYELAMLTADYLSKHGASSNLVIVTPEPEPLAVFGGEASAELERMVEERGIELRLSSDPLKDSAGCDPGEETVVSLPRLVGRGLPGLPVDDEHFLPADDFGRVIGAESVYAAGDVTDFPIKQGGLGAQQADAAASAISSDLGADVEVESFDPVLRARLMGSQPRFLRRDLQEHGGAVVATDALWWPGAKIFGKHLAPFLAALARTEADRRMIQTHEHSAITR